jgi:hypothetical protein
MTMSRKSDTTNRYTRRDFLGKTTAAGAVALVGAAVPAAAQAQAPPRRWNREADVVIIGSGATGLPAAIAARQKGASVIVVEANYDVGGHAIVSSGNVALGGGTTAQKKHGIDDSPDLLYSDLTDWSIVEPNGFPDYRYNDREIMRAFADQSAATYDFLVTNGVTFIERAPDNNGAGNTGNRRRGESAAPGLPADSDRKAGRPRRRTHDLFRHRLHPAARGERPEAGRGHPAQAPHDRDLP